MPKYTVAIANASGLQQDETPSGRHNDGLVGTLVEQLHIGSGQRESQDPCMTHYGDAVCPLDLTFSDGGDPKTDPFQLQLPMRKLPHAPRETLPAHRSDGRGVQPAK
jgi:hypothetical protein